MKDLLFYQPVFQIIQNRLNKCSDETLPSFLERSYNNIFFKTGDDNWKSTWDDITEIASSVLRQNETNGNPVDFSITADELKSITITDELNKLFE